jgi:hypothetical protein
MSSRRKSFGLDTIISGVIEGLGKAVINEWSGYNNEHKTNAHKGVNVIDMQKDDNDCWRMIENE